MGARADILIQDDIQSELSTEIPMTARTSLTLNDKRNALTRSTLSDLMVIGLLARAQGLDLLAHGEHEQKEYGTAKLDASNNVRDLMVDGYSIDRIETTTDGVGMAHVSKVVGMNYPTSRRYFGQ
jgi:hypothetical protein